jgi:exodeoxyribonuclease VII large subunit
MNQEFLDFTFQPPMLREIPYSVSEINRGINEILHKENLFVCVEGEVSGFKKASSGHSYFTLKDEYSKIPAVIWKDKQTNIEQKIEDGMQIIAIAEIKVYQSGGYYQLDIHKAFEAGIGANFVMLEELKRRLANEGLFNPERKRELPKNIRKIGVVTAKNGAAFYDILKIRNEFAPNIDVLLAPASVQGKTAAITLVSALENLNKSDEIDVIIFGRGGGSAEDLAVFNEEIVVRAVANSEIPVISAVGHEIDKSLCDFAADIYAPTPTAAAEIVCRASFEIRNSFQELNARFAKAVRQKFAIIRENEQILDELIRDLRNCFRNFFERKKEMIANYERILNALNPNLPLKKGFALVIDKNGEIVKTTKNLSIRQKLKIKFDKDCFGAEVYEL